MKTPESQAILMYHAIGENLNPEMADPHYTVSESAFSAQLAAMQHAGIQGCSVKQSLENLQREPVANLTFDDGHETNLAAAQTLAQFEMSADFFVNPSTIGTPGFLSWPCLREMIDLGMSIQSHGMTHRYMDEQDLTTLKTEGGDSKQVIEENTGHAVTLFAPPGGRMGADLAQVCEQAGYHAICNSIAGYWQTSQFQHGAKPFQLPRLAVLGGTNIDQFNRWVRTDPSELSRLNRRYRILQAAKRALGNRTYDAMRAMAVRVMP